MMSESRPASGEELRRRAETAALRVAQEAAAHVSAYRRFLRLQGYDVGQLRGFADFCALPVSDRETYVSRYPLADRCLGGELPRAYTVVRNSGTTGQGPSGRGCPPRSWATTPGCAPTCRSTS